MMNEQNISYKNEKLIDLSQTIGHNMPVYPGDTNTNLVQSHFIDIDQYNNFRLETGMHTGTHIDSPMHLTASTELISSVPLECFIGKGCLLDVRNQPIITMKYAYEKLVTENSIVLLYTNFDKHYGSEAYYKSHPVVSMDLCNFLIGKNIKMLGLDMPSPDRFPFSLHKVFLENQICIIENLTNLDQLICEQFFEVMAFPLKINADSSLARVVARVVKKA